MMRNFEIAAQGLPTEQIESTFSQGHYDAAIRYLKKHKPGHLLIPGGAYVSPKEVRFEAVSADQERALVLWVREL